MYIFTLKSVRSTPNKNLQPMKILIAKPGSTSYKFKLYDVGTMSVFYQATVDRIGDKQGKFQYCFESK